ncbi:uncharacterized protein F5147DRAFT_704995 [Suillus discolor]|uniref:Uncharacterized protein n=1 Tax=Suillus discolor TaxID=1912936 RepID=A0A9P7F287_9AGAM|nr:uncharacterized protein F5147DRAFT_704995 [Suillus discolor]KAG2104084.1 hypothetical protein F5147DRAFT_704995 [Suillus discolor]
MLFVQMLRSSSSARLLGVLVSTRMFVILTLTLPLHPLAASLSLDNSILMLVTRVVVPFGLQNRNEFALTLRA